MAVLDQNVFYIIIAVLVVVIIVLGVFLRRRGSKGGPSNVNQYLAREAKLKKVQIAERENGFKAKTPLYLRKPQDTLKDIQEATSRLEKKNIYHNVKIEDKMMDLSQEKQINLDKQLKDIHKKHLELNTKVKPEKGK